MATDKDLGKIIGEGEYVELDIQLSVGRYRVKIKNKLTSETERTVNITEPNERLKLPNSNSRKALFEGRNFIVIYRYINSEYEKVVIDGFDRWLLFFEKKRGIELIDNDKSIAIKFKEETFVFKIIPHHENTEHSLGIEKID
jgi:hypothetical protein